ncbi:glutaredoxin family protein [Bacillaceae bacterium IKA-2]|jgi:glutaredoxin|nr:glutaredoxin family protein [Bacillaceae bacterium IKA-2]
MKITFYTKENCPLCDKGLLVLAEINKDIPFTIESIDIYKDDELLEKYQIMIPVVEVDGIEVDYGILSEEKIRTFLGKAQAPR